MILCGGLTIISSGGGGSQEQGNQQGIVKTPYLIFSTYLGGSTPFTTGGTAHTFAQNATVDSQGNIYVTGATEVSDLPVLNAWQNQPAAGSTLSAFVVKYDPSGNMLWCTYLGGDNQSMGTGIAAMPGGGAAVVGMTTSDSSGPFPTLNPYQAGYNGQSDYFVTVFDGDGSVLYSTYLGGSAMEGEASGNYSDDNSNGNNVSVDAQGLVYVTGTTNSSGGTGAIKFPVTQNAKQPNLAGAGSTDAFLSIIDPTKTGSGSLIYSSFLGGKKNEKGHSIAVSAAGSLIAVAGYTDSSDFPTTSNAYRSLPAPSGWTSNGFVTQFTSSLPGDPSSQYTMGYSTYLGADSNVARDDVYGITLDSNGLIVATGRTQSVDFPMLDSSQPSIYNSAPNPTQNTRNDQPFLVKINPSLSGTASLVYSTFLGGGSTSGGGGAFCTSVAVDLNGNAYVGGETDSQGVLYIPSSVPAVAPELLPYTQDALFPAFQGGESDAILMQVSPDGATLAYSTFLGGQLGDRTYGLAVDPSGNIAISGLTFSSNFPVVNPAQPWPNNPGNQNAFITKFGR
ncbi:MAG: SBBP repeat-containing protein [Proteobacteria bacterium]|nr:SBBP repeat-containing protein [Pseudomonadota bacterium]